MPDSRVPMIKIKKADGTFIEVPLDEFEKNGMASKSVAGPGVKIAELDDESAEEFSIEELVGAPSMKPEGDLNKVPLITVRRPDGTYAKITLKEFELQKNSAAKVVDLEELKKAEAEIDRTPAVAADKKYSDMPKEEKENEKVKVTSSGPSEVQVNIAFNDQKTSEPQKVVEEIRDISSRRQVISGYSNLAPANSGSGSGVNDQNIGIKLQVERSEAERTASEAPIKVVQVETPRVKAAIPTEIKVISEEATDKLAEAIVRKEKLAQEAELQRKADEEKLAKQKKEEADKLAAIARKQQADKEAAALAEKKRIEIESLKSKVESPLPKGESVRPDEQVSPLASVGRESQIDEVLKSLSWKPEIQNTSRLRTIIQLFLKGIRGEEETLELLGRSELDGGAGLSSAQAAEIVEKSGKTNKPSAVENVPSLKNPLAKPVLEIESENDRFEHELPMVGLQTTDYRLRRDLPKPVVVPQPIAKEVPVVAVKPAPPVIKAPAEEKVAPTIKSPTQEKKLEAILKSAEGGGLQDPYELKPLTKIEAIPRGPVLGGKSPIEKEFKIKESIKPSMKDVTRAAAVEVGPIDEIRDFSLTDFRRLADDPASAGRKLRQKFSNLRDESIVMYIDALGAWRNSPLFDQYIKLIAESLSKGIPLSTATGDKDGIQISELMTILALEKEIN